MLPTVYVPGSMNAAIVVFQPHGGAERMTLERAQAAGFIEYETGHGNLFESYDLTIRIKSSRVRVLVFPRV